MADDLADEVKVFRRKHAEDDETTAQSSQQLLEDKKDVALETELETRPTASENLLGAKGIFKPTALNSPSFGLMQQFSPNYAMFAMPFFMSNPAAAAAAYAQTAARMSPGGYMHMMPASPSFVQMNPMNMYHNLQMLTSPSSPIYAQMAGKAGQIPLAANMRGNPLNQMNNMRLPYNPMASMANTMAQQAGTPKRSMDERRRPHIKKPLNAFMWYMKENRPKLMLEMNYKEKQSAELNKELGRRWHSLNKEEQQPYFDLAKKDREEHKEKYPTWSARENYAIHKKKKRKREKSEEVGDFKKCRARFGVLNQDRWCKFCKRKKKCEYSMERSTSSTEPSIPEFGMKMELELDEGMDVIDDPEASESESDGDEIDDPALTQQACNEVALQQDAV